MKFKKLFISLIALSSISFASAEEWKITGTQITAKKSPAIKIASNPDLKISASISGEKLVISFSDGKQKFGSPVITIKKGDITYRRPRLKLTVPLASAKGVTADSPLLVTAFRHKTTDFDLHLVHDAESEIPNLVITQK